MKKPDNFTSLGLDKWDRKIMYELDVDSRRSNSEIAKRLGVGKNFVNYRINRMTEAGLIKGFCTIIDGYKLGDIAIRVYLKWGFASPEKETEMVKFISENPYVWWVGTISGEWNLGFVVWVWRFAEFEKFWFELMGRYQKNIHKRVVAVYSRMWDCSYAFLSPESVDKRPYQIIGNTATVRLSKKENLLLHALAEDARIPTVELAKKTGLSVSGVKGALKRLISTGVIKGFRAIFDTEALGYMHFKVDFFLRDSKDYEKMLQFALENPNVVYVNKTIGYADFEVDVMSRSHLDLRSFISSFGKRFGESIIEYSYFVYEKNSKKKYFSYLRLD